MSEQESPIIYLPEDEEWVALLKQKKADYERRLAQDSDRKYQAPEIRERQTEYALRVLSLLLEEGNVATFTLSREIYEEEGDSMNADDLNMALSVIATYATNREFLESRLARA